MYMYMHVLQQMEFEEYYCRPLSPLPDIHCTVYMNSHVHSAPQSKKEHVHEHTLYRTQGEQADLLRDTTPYLE